MIFDNGLREARSFVGHAVKAFVSLCDFWLTFYCGGKMSSYASFEICDICFMS